MGLRTRFAPSPTGFLHLGSAFSALFAFRLAQKSGGDFILRIEDIDGSRCRSRFEEAIFQDLMWLGLEWETPVRRQSEHLTDYTLALQTLKDRDLIYPCFCSRSDIAAEIRRAGVAPHRQNSGIYPGTCKRLSSSEKKEKIDSGAPAAWRLDIHKALEQTGPLYWHDRQLGKVRVALEQHGDVVVERRDIRTSYHLSVTLDDHIQEISLITRGEDLIPATSIHVLLQSLLGLETPEYFHHRLVTNDLGVRLAKRNDGQNIRSLKEAGFSPDAILKMIEFD